MKRYASVIDRFMARIERDADSGCWNWRGCLTFGYGSFHFDKKLHRAHRAAYMLLIGPIPSGKVLHHKCDNKRCVNPEHLQPITQKKHILQLSPTHLMYKNAHKTKCPKGHRLTKKNLVRADWLKGRRSCRKCAGERAAEYQKRTYHIMKAARQAKRNLLSPRNEAGELED